MKKNARSSGRTPDAALPFLFAPRPDAAISVLARSVLREFAFLNRPRAPIAEAPRPAAVPAPSPVRIPFDPAPYLVALTGLPSEAPAGESVTFTTVPRQVSDHLLSLTVSSPVPRRIRAPFFRPADLPEFASFAPKPFEEQLPTLSARLRAQAEIPAAMIHLTGEMAGEALSGLERAVSPLNRVAGALPNAFGMKESRDDILPVSDAPVIPRTIATASGVPASLPWVDDVPMGSPVASSQWPVGAEESGGGPAPVRERHLSFLERWERIHGRMADAVHAPGAPWRSAVSFALLAVLAVGPVGAVGFAAKSDTVKAQIEASGREGLGALSAAGRAAASRDLGVAADAFGDAAFSFGEARGALAASVGSLRTLAGMVPGVGDDLRAADDLLVAADALSRALSRITGAAADAHGSPLYVIAALSAASQEALPDVMQADDALSAIHPSSLPPALADGVGILGRSVSLARTTIEGFPRRADALAAILGRDGARRYLVVFQNANELRATGGFIGSIAEVTVDRGEIVEVRVPSGGSYDLQGDLRASVLPPDPLLRVAGKWQFHDANWFPDFPTTAETLAWFYEKAGGPSVDGVVAVTSEILPELLRITGPISMPEYRRTMTEENVIAETQQIVETEYDPGKNAPKQFIGELLGEVLRRLSALPPEKVLDAGSALSGALRAKTIQISLFDDGLAALAADEGWDGALYTGDGDALMIVDTNIGGGKTDAVMRKDAEVTVRLEPDGVPVTTVTLRYAHEGIPSDRMSGETYRDYLRLYVPLGSELLDVAGDLRAPASDEFEPADPIYGVHPLLAETIGHAVAGPRGTSIWDERGRRVFGTWLTVKPGEDATVTFAYRSGARAAGRSMLAVLAGTPVRSYRFLLEKQPGSTLRASVAVEPPPGERAAWSSPDLLAERDLPTALVRDRFYGMALTGE